MTHELRVLIRKRKKAFKQLKESKFADVDISRTFKQLRTKCNNLYRQLQNRHFHELCTKYTRSPAKFWKVINTVTRRTPRRDNVPLDATCLNQYFHTTVTDNTASYQLPLGPERADDLTTFEAVDAQTVEHLLNGLQPRKAPGPDGILPVLLKVASEVIAPSLAAIFNVSLSKGVVPRAFKLAHVTPIRKSRQQDATKQSNYRPISLTSVLSKLLEKIVHRQLEEHFEDNWPYSEHQYGFMRKRSTAQLLTRITNDWQLANDSGLTTAVVFIDVSKAFDKVTHQTLLLTREPF